MSNINYSKPIKESYNADIRDSRQEDKTHLMYEFIDDYTYEDSKHVLIHIKKAKGNKFYLYASMENGPKDKETLNKLVSWKISGNKSLSETGHQGGGNCRFIYGHDNTEKVILNSMVSESEFIRLETSPDRIYEYSSKRNDISEGDFQKIVDRDCIKWSSDTLDYEEEGSWFEKYRDEIFQKTRLNINYLIRFTLTTLPIDYKDKDHWEYFKIRMKNYKIPVYFMNEVLEEDTFSENKPLDLIGLDLNHRVKDSEKEFKLLIDYSDNYYIQDQTSNQIRNANNTEIVEYNEDMIAFANIECFRMDKKHLTEELKKLNKISKDIRKYNHEDFYGIYIWMNEKVVDFLPITDILQLSKQFAGTDEKPGGNSQFRVILKPIVNNDILNRFIITNTVKAKTTFRDKSKVKTSMKTLQNIYIGKGINKKPSKKTIVKKEKTEKGGVYLVYLNNGLYKYGMVTEYSHIDRRMKDHKNNCIEKVKEFMEHLNDKTVPTMNKCIEIYKKEHEHPSGAEEKIKEIIENNKRDKIKILESNRSKNESREYFICEDFNYIYNTIHDLINVEFE